MQGARPFGLNTSISDSPEINLGTPARQSIVDKRALGRQENGDRI